MTFSLPVLLTESDREINNPVINSTVSNLSGVEFFSRFLSNLISLGFILATFIAVIILLTGGIKWITSGGDKEAKAKAQGTFTAAVAGLILVFTLYAVLRLIGYFFGIELIKIDISNLLL